MTLDDRCAAPGLRGMGPSATVAINEHCNALIGRGRRVFKLGLGQSPFPVPRPVVRALEQHAGEKDYLPVQGLYELRRAVATHLGREPGIACEAEDVIVGPGSKELMFQLLLAFEGEVLVPSPAWVSYGPQARILGRPFRRVHTRREDEWRLSAEQLDAVCRTSPGPRLLILNYPNNPSGGTYGPDALAELAEVARRHRVLVLSDEIYGRLHHDGQHVSIARFYPEGTIYSGGLSKWCGAGGWRLGVFAVPRPLRWLRDALVVIASETFTSTCAPVQYAAIEAYENRGEVDDYLRRSRRVLSALGHSLWERLRGAAIDCIRPRGGFYLFADFSAHRGALRRRGIVTDRQLCERLLEDTGVAILPGSCFGREPEELTARMAYVCFDGERALAGADEIEGPGSLRTRRFLERRCGDVLEAADRIAGWSGSMRRAA